MHKLYQGEIHCHYYRAHPVWKLRNPKGNSLLAIERNYVKAAQTRELDFLFLTPDTNLDDALFNLVFTLENKYQGKSGFLVIAGQELTFPDGHVLALGISSKLMETRTLDETVENIRGAQALALAAHPHTPDMWNWDCFVAAVERHLFDGVEFNLYTHPDKIDILEDFVEKKQNITKSCFMAAGSDVHGVPDAIGTLGTTHVLAEDLSKDSILQAMRNRLTVAQYGDRLVGHPELIKQVKNKNR